MSRLSDLHDELAKATAVRWDPRSVDVDTLIQRAQTERAAFIAAQLRRSIEGFARWSGLTALTATLRYRLQRRRTLRQLSQLDDRMLSDIGLSRAKIDATATVCSDKPSACDSVWHQLAAWVGRDLRRRQTLRELSAMPDEMMTDIGITRSEIPAIAAGQSSASQPVATVDVETQVPVYSSVLALIEAHRSLRPSANEILGRSTAA